MAEMSLLLHSIDIITFAPPVAFRHRTIQSLHIAILLVFTHDV